MNEVKIETMIPVRTIGRAPLFNRGTLCEEIRLGVPTGRAMIVVYFDTEHYFIFLHTGMIAPKDTEGKILTNGQSVVLIYQGNDS